MFAPDGVHVVFSASQGQQEIESDIYEVPLHGGPVATLVNHPADDRVIGFSPDGRRLAILDRDQSNNMWIMENF